METKMVEKYLLANNQDQLTNGLIKTVNEEYVALTNLGVIGVADKWKGFEEQEKQDKLNLGLIRFRSTNEYISINQVKSVESQPVKEAAKDIGVVGLCCLGGAGAYYGIDWVVKKFSK